MSKISEELEFVLNRLVEEKMKLNYAGREKNEAWIYESFAVWLVEKFKEENHV